MAKEMLWVSIKIPLTTEKLSFVIKGIFRQENFLSFSSVRIKEIPNKRSFF
jgi:hypothetical protein